MSGETEANVSGWTTDTLKAYFESVLVEMDRRYGQRFADSEKATSAALSAAQRATEKADNATEKRFEGVNEFRLTLSDQARDLMPRKEVETIVGNLEGRLRVIESAQRDVAGRSRGLSEGWGYLVGAVGVIAAVAGIILATR